MDEPALIQRFLNPHYAVATYDNVQWRGSGDAQTPAEDAHCRLYLACGSDDDNLTVVFAAFGPPVVVACADWVCEWLTGRTIEAARGLSVQDVENALVLAPSQRYAALLVIDALDDALANTLTNLGK